MIKSDDGEQYYIKWNGQKISTVTAYFSVDISDGSFADMSDVYLKGDSGRHLIDSALGFYPKAAQIKRWPALMIIEILPEADPDKSNVRLLYLLFPRRRWWWLPWLMWKLARYAHLPSRNRYLYFSERFVNRDGNSDFDLVALWPFYRSRLRCIWSIIEKHWDEWIFQMQEIGGNTDEAAQKDTQ